MGSVGANWPAQCLWRHVRVRVHAASSRGIAVWFSEDVGGKLFDVHIAACLVRAVFDLIQREFNAILTDGAAQNVQDDTTIVFKTKYGPVLVEQDAFHIPIIDNQRSAC